MQLNSPKDLPQTQIKTVSLKLNDLEKPPIEDTEQLLTSIKIVFPKLKDSEKPLIKDAKQLLTPSKMVLPDLLALNTTRTLRQYFKYN